MTRPNAGSSGSAIWREYTAAYEAVLSKTSSDQAPWYIVPANRKWYRDLVQTLKSLGMKYPQPEENLDGVVVE